MASTTIISAPGKVLITGGYLVLDPAYDGTVLATSARFFTVIRSSDSVQENGICVRSPQFLEAEWSYSLHNETNGDLVLTPSVSNTSSNKFVEIALRETLKIAHEISPKSRNPYTGLQIDILGDNDFYSQRRVLESLSLPPNRESLDRLPRFNHLETVIGDVHKTGLGSSAALITSLVTALVVHLSIVPASSLANYSRPRSTVDSDTQQDLEFIHNTSQYIHCLAQGKVGSGFDISSAVYGSQVYRRFNDSVLRPLMDDNTVSTPNDLLKTLRNHTEWTCQTRPVVLPPMVRLLLADVDAGSDTPSLVGKVLKWRQSFPDQAHEVWERLQSNNNGVVRLLEKLTGLAQSDPDGYIASLRHFAEASQKPAGNLECFEVIRDLKDIMTAVRQGMKAMGQSAGVPIEPDEQSELLDACCAIPGVIGGGVPGAGGYDAIYVLVVDPKTDLTSAEDAAAVKKILSLWSDWESLAVSPLQSRAEEGGLRYYGALSRVEGLEGALSTCRRV